MCGADAGFGSSWYPGVALVMARGPAIDAEGGLGEIDIRDAAQGGAADPTIGPGQQQFAGQASVGRLLLGDHGDGCRSTCW